MKRSGLVWFVDTGAASEWWQGYLWHCPRRLVTLYTVLGLNVPWRLLAGLYWWVKRPFRGIFHPDLPYATKILELEAQLRNANDDVERLKIKVRQFQVGRMIYAENLERTIGVQMDWTAIDQEAARRVGVTFS